MKILVAIITCHAFKERADAQRATWAKHAPGADVRFFLGRAERDPLADEVYLDCSDGYEGLPTKTKAVCAWALEHRYDLLVKTDDDSYININRLVHAGFQKYDYTGRFRASSGGYKARYASGFFYCLSRRAMQIVVDAPLTEDLAEDRWLGNMFAQHKEITIHDEQPRLTIANDKGRPVPHFGREAPTPRNNIIASCEFTPAQMREIHRAWENPNATISNLSDVSILITSFLRPGCLQKCLQSLKNLPECRVIIADDSGDGIQADIKLPFDSGLPAKRNAGVRACKTKYLLMGCDDFDFGTQEARNGIIKLLETLDNNPHIDVAGGHVNNNSYEGFLQLFPGSHIKETRLRPDGKRPYYKVDLTVNYFLARTESIRSFPWDERMRIGGEHFDWFWDLKRASKYVVWVPGVNINQLPYNVKNEHHDYAKFRGRAVNLGHKIMLEKRGVKRYLGFDEKL